MFYKVLVLEILACLSLVSLKVYQSLPATQLAVGDKVVTIKAESPKEAVAELAGRELDYVQSTFSGLHFPVQGYGLKNIISGFGDKRGKRSHQGVDIKAPRGTNIVAVTDGFVERIKEGGSGGKQVYLRDGSGRLFYYAHLDSWAVEEFAAVKAGEVLGAVGDTGNAKGTTPHLHFEVLLGKDKAAIDPLKFWIGV